MRWIAERYALLDEPNRKGLVVTALIVSLEVAVAALVMLGWFG